MTADQITFLTDINLEYIKQVERERNKSFVSDSDKMYRRYLLILKRCYALMLNDYFNVFHEDDVNFATAVEMQNILDRFNDLCNTEYTVDFTLTETSTPSSPVWDDTDVWDDTQTWQDNPS